MLRRILLGALALILLIFFAGFYVVARPHLVQGWLERHLSELTEGELHFESVQLSTGKLSRLTFENFHYQSPSQSHRLGIDRLQLSLNVLSLFPAPRLSLEIDADSPSLLLTKPSPTRAQPRDPSELRSLPAWLFQTLLRIKSGRIEFRGEDRGLLMEHLNGELRHAPDRILNMEFRAQIPQEGEPALIEISGEIPTDATSLTQVQGIRAEIANLDTARFKHSGWSLQGPLFASFRITREVSGRCRLMADTRTSLLRLRIPGQQSLHPVPPVRAVASLQTSEESVRLESGQLHWGDIELLVQGSLGKSTAELTVSSRPLPLKKLIKLLPEEVVSGIAAGSIQEADGSLELKNLRFELPHPARLAPGNLLPVGGRLSLLLSGPDLRLAADTEFERRGAGIDGQIALTQTESPIPFKLFIASPWELPLEISGSAQLQATVLHELLALPEPLRLEGIVPVEIAADMAPESSAMNLKADLSALGATWNQFALKAPEVPSSLQVSMSRNKKHTLVEAARLSLGPLSIDGRGEILSAADWRMEIRVPGTPLSGLSDLAPLLEKVALDGNLSAQLQFNKDARGILPSGHLDLDNVTFAMPGPTGNLKEIRGRFNWDEQGIRGENIQALLETSPVRLDIGLYKNPAPHIDVRLEAPAVRANELVFRSPDQLLHDLSGKLRIDAGGIVFDDISVRLEQGTIARVNGFLADYRTPRVFLEVDGDFARVDEIIALFKGPPRAPPRYASAHSEPIPVYVQVFARAPRGSLGNLRFQDATAGIIAHEGTLSVYPLHLKSGAGYFVGKVFSDLKHLPTPSLRVSGHLERFKASDLQRYLGGNAELIEGTMRGSFFLEGEAGANFANSISGGIHLDAGRGTLYRFQFLSKIFSLINVSQILSFKLPDMSTEGMPFNSLRGNLRAQDGTLSTEDLFMDSEAMNLSLIGKVNLENRRIDALMGVKPLKTVDKVITNIPLAGWILAGEEKALLTAHFRITGDLKNPATYPVPITSVSEKVIGILRRTLGLPGKILTDMGASE